MKVGINMLLWATHVTKEHRAQIKKIKAAGADGVEIPIFEGEVPHYRELATMLDDIGLERTSCIALTTPGNNPISDDAAERQKAVDTLRHLIDCSSAVGATVMCGPMFQTLGVFSGSGPTATEKKRAADVLRAVADHAKQANVVLAVEPLNRFEAYLLNTLADASAFVKGIHHPNVGVLYDTFHANIEEKNPAEQIRKHGKCIRHVHTCSNDRGIPGQDHIDWDGTFRSLHAIGYDGWLVIEAFGRALPGIAAATKIWRDMFPSSDSVAKTGVPFLRKEWKRTARK
jgi:D-psicose/D-tagatose/L-ribulose 3-epimerase